jgi:hypothetical protein
MPAAAFLKFIFVCLSLVAALSTSGVCAEKKTIQWRDFRVLEGAAAGDFLIGKSVVDRNWRELTFFFDHETAMIGGTDSGECEISPWEFGEDRAGLSDQTRTNGRWFHVLARPTNAKNPHGATMGYYIDGGFNARFEESLLKDYSAPIRKGNVMNCPTPTGIPRQIPAVLSGFGSYSSRFQIALNSLPQSPSSPASLERELIGNSVIWPPDPYEPCGRIDYFARGGRIYSFYCEPDYRETPSDRPSFRMGYWRWKIIGNHFCIQPHDESRHFDECDPIVLIPSGAQPLSMRGEAQMRMFYLRHVVGGAFVGLGYVVKGNPAGFPHN